MAENNVVSQQDWEKARKELLQKEKEFTRQRDELSRLRRQLPVTRVEKDYRFEGVDGTETLGDLFQSCSQLIVYHFMFDPEWTEGCKACSFLADHYNPSVIHLQQRDVSLVTVSRAPLEKLETFRKRMGWSLKWVSSYESDFNYDFHVSFTPEQLSQETVYYNYQNKKFPLSEGPGFSVFSKNQQGEIFHTYSVYERGLDLFLNAYNLLDMTPKGRDEESFVYPMEWVRYHDRYGDQSFADPYVELLGPGNKES